MGVENHTKSANIDGNDDNALRVTMCLMPVLKHYKASALTSALSIIQSVMLQSISMKKYLAIKGMIVSTTQLAADGQIMSRNAGSNSAFVDGTTVH